MKRFFLFLIILGALTSFGFADSLKLPFNLEVVSQDSSFITVRNKETGIVRRLLFEGKSPSLSWQDNRVLLDNPYPTDDTCFYLKRVGHVRPMGHDVFGDANHNGFPEIAGAYGGRTWISEYSGHDTTYILRDSIYDALPVDYAKDSDGDGLLEYLATGIFHARGVIYETQTPQSLPIDSVYAWPYGYLGGIFDIDGDGRIEVAIKSSHNRIQVWRSIGDSAYDSAYTVAMPDSFGALFAQFVYGDFDGDGKNEIITSSDIGLVLAFEYVAPDSFALVWEDSVFHYNANMIVGPTDMDGDGRKEFVVMSNSIAMGGFFYYFFESTGDNQFAQVAVDSIPGDPWEDGGLGLWDFDRDGVDELAVGTADKVGIYKSDGDNSWQLIYLRAIRYLIPRMAGCQIIWTYDTNNNGYGEIVMDGGTDYGNVIVEYTPGRGVAGDINCDCEVNAVDVAYLVDYFKGRNNLLPPDTLLADVNGNCEINGVDVVYFVNYLKGGPALRQCR